MGNRYALRAARGICLRLLYAACSLPLSLCSVSSEYGVWVTGLLYKAARNLHMCLRLLYASCSLPPLSLITVISLYEREYGMSVSLQAWPCIGLLQVQPAAVSVVSLCCGECGGWVTDPRYRQLTIGS